MIYYSHVNEDNHVERNALFARHAKSLYAIAGSGERVIALMDCPALGMVHLIDNNWDALYLCELKITALTHLNIEDYRSFVGLELPSEQRWTQFEALKPRLSEGCQHFWALRKNDIEIGICNCGHFEQFLQRANPTLRFFLGKCFYQCFSVPKADWKGFPTLRWRIVKAMFSCRWTYWLFGMKDSAFVSRDSALQVIPAALQKSLDEDEVSKSSLFHLVFNGNLYQMSEENLPPSFQKSVLLRIKAALKDDHLKVNYHNGDVLDVLTKINVEQGESRFFSLSDILSFFNLDYQQKLVDLITATKTGTGRLIFRAFIRNRLTQEQFADLKNKYSTLRDLSKEERSHFYQVFQIDF